MVDVTPRRNRLLPALPVIVVCIYLVAPVLAQIAYAFVDNSGQLTTEGFTAIFRNPKFLPSLGLTLVTAIATVAMLIVCLVPAIVAVKLWAPRLRGALEILCTLPLVIPAIALVAGLMSVLRGASRMGRGSPGAAFSQFMQLDSFPLALVGTYVILALPFTYRSLNAALSSIPLATLYEASASLGSSTWGTLRRVIIPNISGSVMFSAFFAFALAFGEYTVAATLSIQTLPVWMTVLSSSNFRASITLSLLMNLLTWALLAFATVYASRFGASKRARDDRTDKKRSTPVFDISQDQQGDEASVANTRTEGAESERI